MKKFLLPVLLLIVITAKAQNVPNGSFENWNTLSTAERPDFWKTIDTIAVTQGQTSVTKTTDASNGLYAMRLQTFLYLGFLTVPGVATNGNINTSTYQIIGGTPDTMRHAKLFGSYKYAPVSGDSCFILVSLTKWDSIAGSRINIASGAFGTNDTVATYTDFELTLNYGSLLNPDTVLIQIFNAVLGSAHAGTVMFVDNLHFSEFVGVNDFVKPIKNVVVFPNPANEKINFEITSDQHNDYVFSVNDILGKEIVTKTIRENKFEINTATYPSGEYLYSIRNKQGLLLKSDKFSIKH